MVPEEWSRGWMKAVRPDAGLPLPQIRRAMFRKTRLCRQSGAEVCNELLWVVDLKEKT